MRKTTFFLLTLAVACNSAPEDPTTAAKTRPQRPNLLADAGALCGAPLAERMASGWQLRSLHRAGAASGSDDSYLGVTRREAKGGLGEAAPATPAAAAPERLLAVMATKAGADGAVTADSGTGRWDGAPAEAPRDAIDPGVRLRAGSTDDNRDFDAFVRWLDEQRAGSTPPGGFVDIDVRGRTALQIVDVDGNVVPGVPVTIVDESADAVVWRGTTYGDGRVPYYPAIARSGGDGGLLVEVTLGERMVSQRWDGTGAPTIRLPVRRAEEPLQLDVAFVIDTTGSMGDEIAAIKATLLQVTARLRGLGREFDLRYGAVLYRDVGDDYVTAKHDFTADIEAFDALLRTVQAGGGGDGPESLNQGLAVAIDGIGWRSGAAKVAFLIADAPPHLDYEGDVAYDKSLVAAVARGVRVHSVAASGLDAAGSVVFRQIAQFTRGEFVFLEYGGDLAGSAAAHGVQQATGNNLDDILFTRIRDEIAHWGREVEGVAAGGAEPGTEPR